MNTLTSKHPLKNSISLYDLIYKLNFTIILYKETFFKIDNIIIISI